MSKLPRNVAFCPCQSGRSYAACCRPFHLGEAVPQTVEALMRSRYSAFALHLTDYIWSTWHPDYRPTLHDLRADHGVQWRRLEVLGADEGPSHGVVEFRAYWRTRTDRGVVHERSSFVKEDGLWYYTVGMELA